MGCDSSGVSLNTFELKSKPKEREMDEDVTVISSKRLAKLERSHKFLVALESAGVDNWDGYSLAYNKAFPNEFDEE